MEKCPNLKDLRIKVARGKPWPITKLSPETMRGFFTYLIKIPSHFVGFRDVDVVRVMDEYYKNSTALNADGGVFDLSFTSLLDEGEKAATLEFTNLEQNKKKSNWGTI